MANLSDAFGNIIVDKVGKEFLEFVNTVQRPDAYYVLVDNSDIEGVEPDENGDMSFDFCTPGRWSYENNLRGYLEGEWLKERPDKHVDAYDNLIKAIKEKNGRIIVEYKDSDTAT